MNKKGAVHVLLIVIVGLILTSIYFSGAFSVIADDYLPYDDLYTPVQWESYIAKAPGVYGVSVQTSSVGQLIDSVNDKFTFQRKGSAYFIGLAVPIAENGELTGIRVNHVAVNTPDDYRNRNDYSDSITINKIVQGQDFKVLFKVSASGYPPTTSGVSMILNGVNIGSATGTTTLSGTFELRSSRIDPEKAEIFINGISKGEVTLPSVSELKLSPSCGGYHGHCSASMTIEPKFRVPFSCTFSDDELLAMETFQGGDEIDIFSTRFPVKKFCLAHPVIITSATQDGSTATAEPYQKLVRGELLDIPTDQTWSVFYVFDNSEQLVPTGCDTSSEIYNIESENCVKTSGVVQVCSGGIFDPDSGLCVVENVPICEKGYYDESTLTCIYNPPVNQVCEEGTYDSETGQCIIYLEQEQESDSLPFYSTFFEGGILSRILSSFLLFFGVTI